VDRPLPSGVGVADDDVGLDPLVGHGQQSDAGLPALGQGGRDVGEGKAGVEHPGTDEVRRQVAVAETEPVGLRSVGGQLLLDRPPLVGASPAALLVDAAAEGVHHRVEVGADPQAVQRHVVAGVDHGGDRRAGHRGAHTAEKTSPTGPTGEHNYLHETHRAAWAVVDCSRGVSWCWTEVRKGCVTTDAGVASRLHRAKLTPEQRHACNSRGRRVRNPGAARSTYRTQSERGRIVMAEVSWLSDYVNGPDRSERAARAVQGMDAAPGGSAFDRTFAGQGIAGLLGIGLEADAQSWQERALCAETDPEAFFPEKGGSTREAKKICTGCEVKAECLEYALANDERFGIWGGLSERERRRLRRRAV
jgi:WhiB family redox-sensing transcriptional regulator